MALQNVQNKEMRLVLSSDAKPRLKWTAELHQCFIDAVHQLGGPEKATPKSLMRAMGIHGLTLYHLKSHLQKYRLGKIQQSQANQHQKLETGNVYPTKKICDEEPNKINESLRVSQALKIQMEVQRELHEQIQVQRHLQLRIEAQGKYLQSVLRKAQETLSGYSSCSIEVERAKVQLSQLMSMVESGCQSSSFSILTESDGSVLKDGGNKVRGCNGYSLDSCSLTSSESSGRKEDSETKHQIQKGKRKPVMLSLMDMHPPENRKRSKNTNDEVCRLEQSRTENSDDEQVQRLKTLENIDLNCKFQNEFDLGSKVIDLNCGGLQLF